MAVFLNDTFTDTDATLLENHDPDVGDAGSWEALGFGIVGATPGAVLEIQTNRLEASVDSAQGPTHRNNTDPGADEYDYLITMSHRASPQVNRFQWVCFCMSPTGTANADVDRYVLVAENNASPGEWVLYKVVNGSNVELDSASDEFAGTVDEIVIEVRSDGIAVFLDGAGTPIVSSADTDLARPGRIGVGAGRGDSDQWIDDLSVDTVAAGGGGSADGGKFTIAGALNRIAGTVGFTEAGAANAAAGTTSLSLAGALNDLAGTTQLTEAGAANALNGTTDRTLAGALNEYLESL